MSLAGHALCCSRGERRRVRHTRDCWAGRPVPYFVLHRIGFSMPPASLPGAVGSYPTFSPLPRARGEAARRRAVCSLWHCPSRRLDPPCPGLSSSDSGRRPCGQPHRRDSVSCRESCPMVSGLSSPNRRSHPGCPGPGGVLGAGLPAPSGCFQRTERRSGPKTKDFNSGAGEWKTQEHLFRAARDWPTGGWTAADRRRCWFLNRRRPGREAMPPNIRSGRTGRRSPPCPTSGFRCRC